VTGRIPPAGGGGGPLVVTGPGDDGEVLDELLPDRVRAARDGASPARLAELEAKIARAVARSRAEATLRAYRSDWADFVCWCDQVGLDALPASLATVAGYVAELADPPDDRAPRRVSTIERRLAAIGEGHKVAGHPNPARGALVAETMKGIRRTLGVAPTQKRGVSTADVRAAVAELGDRLIDDRDRLILLLGFAGGFRRAELVGLDVADVAVHPEGLLVQLRKSKTDQDQAGRRVEIVYGAQATSCPVRAWRTWLDRARITDGPVFRPIDRHGNLSPKRLSAQAVAIVIKRHMRRLGYDTTDFAGHSLRRGMATTAARNGAAERTIMRATGHTATETLRGYIEEAAQFTDPASQYLDL
jgi:site-specific recombinase XerD